MNFSITQKTADAINSHFQIPTGPARLLMIRSGLVMEIRFPGSRLTGKTHKCSTILRREFGLSGRPIKLLAIFESLLQETRVIQEGDCHTFVDPETGKLAMLTREEKAQQDKERSAESGASGEEGAA